MSQPYIRPTRIAACQEYTTQCVYSTHSSVFTNKYTNKYTCISKKKNPRITWFPRQLFRDGELHKKKRQNNVGATTRLGVSREFKTTHDAEKKYNQRSVADHSVQQFKDVSNKSGIYNNTTVSYFIFYQYLFISFCVYLYCYILYLEISNLCRVILVVVTIAILTLMN